MFLALWRLDATDKENAKRVRWEWGEHPLRDEVARGRDGGLMAVGPGQEITFEV